MNNPRRVSTQVAPFHRDMAPIARQGLAQATPDDAGGLARPAMHYGADALRLISEQRALPVAGREREAVCVAQLTIAAQIPHMWCCGRP